MRKHTLEYDDVMNKQRKEVYALRNELLFADKPIDFAAEVLESICQMIAQNTTPQSFLEKLLEVFPIQIDDGIFDNLATAQEL